MLPLFSECASLDEARIMLIGQGPSLTDDSTSLPYIGPTAAQGWRDLVADLRLARERAISM